MSAGLKDAFGSLEFTDDAQAYLGLQKHLIEQGIMHKFYVKKDIDPGTLKSLLGGAGVIVANITKLMNSGEPMV